MNKISNMKLVNKLCFFFTDHLSIFNIYLQIKYILWWKWLLNLFITFVFLFNMYFFYFVDFNQNIFYLIISQLLIFYWIFGIFFRKKQKFINFFFSKFNVFKKNLNLKLKFHKKKYYGFSWRIIWLGNNIS